MEEHLKGIGVENYRIFEKAQYFDFAPITLLTGANSSGKSSLIKALKFLHETYGNADKNEYQYKVGDLEKLFTQNKNFDFKTSPLLNTRNVLNNNSKIKASSFYHYQYLKEFGDDIRLLIKFNYKVEDHIEFKSLSVFIDVVKETPLTLFIEKSLHNQKQLAIDDTLQKEIISISIGEFEKVEVEIDVKILFFIFQAKSAYFFKIYQQKQLFEVELNILDSKKIREKIDNYFSEKKLTYQIGPYLENNNKMIGINLLNHAFDMFEYNLGSFDGDYDKRITYKRNGKFENELSFIDQWLENNSKDIFSFKDKMRAYYSSDNDGDNEIEFTNSVFGLLSAIKWTNYFFLQEDEVTSDGHEIYNFEEFRFNTSFVSFFNGYIVKGKHILDIKNPAIYGFSLYTLFNFLKAEIKKKEFDKKTTLTILKKHLTRPIDEGFVSNLLIPFLNILLNNSIEEVNIKSIDDVKVYSRMEYSFHREFLQNIFTPILKPLPSFSNIIFISNERTSSDLFFNINSAEELNIFKNFNKNKDQRGLIIDILKDLDIADDISIELDNEQKTYKIILKTNGKTINLKELGYGIVKLLPIIILIRPVVKRKNYYDIGNGPEKFADDEYYPTTIIIEEPESNLHPALQSKLADMFMNLSKKFNIHFIIETHSEYLIRKLQYLTAKGEISPNATKIHYFYHPDKIPAGETQTFPINIREDGSLTRNFGTGFFDEADNIALELFLLKTHQSN